MCRQGLKDYFANELAETTTGDYVIPLMWITRDAELCADAHAVTVTAVSVQDDRPGFHALI